MQVACQVSPAGTFFFMSLNLLNSKCYKLAAKKKKIFGEFA